MTIYKLQKTNIYLYIFLMKICTRELFNIFKPAQKLRHQPNVKIPNIQRNTNLPFILKLNLFL